MRCRACLCVLYLFFFFFKQKTAYEMRISDWSSDVCSSDLAALAICAPAFVTAFFVGGKMTQVNGAIMADIVIALVAGLPSYVLVKVFQPAFFSRERSEERRVGKECVSTCRSRWSPSHSKKK